MGTFVGSTAQDETELNSTLSIKSNSIQSQTNLQVVCCLIAKPEMLNTFPLIYL